jgi:hypothetical protein
MHNASVPALALAVFIIPSVTVAQQTPAPAGRTFTLSGEMLRGYQNLQRDLAETAEKMPDEHYGFRPTPEIKPFGQLVAHVALAQFRTCAMLKGEPNPRQDEKEDASRSKAEEIALLKASSAYCDPPVSALTDSTMTDLAKVGQNQVAKGLIPAELVTHGMEMYGTMAVYLRLKGIVPPTTERQNQQMKKEVAKASRRLVFDQAHAEQPPPGQLDAVAKKLGLEIQTSAERINSAALEGARILYLRAPSTEFTDTEIETIIAFVKGGGSLLLVLDEERRQSLKRTRVNDLLSPFDMRLTPDTEYLHNNGGIAKAGEINKADREVPFDGGRAVEGGTAFAFQLDKEGSPSQPFGAYKRLDNGGRIVVLGEGMASLFLGHPNGVRLSGDPNNPTTYWGKDSAIFMEEVLTWLSR